MLAALTESLREGLTRIEISYYADTKLAQDQLLQPDYAVEMSSDLNIVRNALNSAVGLCYRVPFQRLMEVFQDKCKSKQLYIQQPHVCALIYAKNAKRGCYTGFYKDIPKTVPFDHEEFLQANALPGPKSIIQCLISNGRKNKVVKHIFYEKGASVGQIPGFSYDKYPVPEIPILGSWEGARISPTMRRNLEMAPIEPSKMVNMPTKFDETSERVRTASMKGFTCWCSTFGISRMEQLKDAPLRIKKMLQSNNLKHMILIHFAQINRKHPDMKQKEVPVYADEVEQAAMEISHQNSITLLKAFMDGLQYLDRGRALEAAAGDGRVSRDLLNDQFTAIDCFDMCYKSVRELETLQSKVLNIEKVD